MTQALGRIDRHEVSYEGQTKVKALLKTSYRLSALNSENEAGERCKYVSYFLGKEHT